MKKLDYDAHHYTSQDPNALRDKINEIIDEIEEIKVQLSRIKKDRPDPRTKSPYDLSKRKYNRQK